MKTDLGTLNPSFVNDGTDCPSAEYTHPDNGEPHGGLKGSNEFICKYILILLTPSIPQILIKLLQFVTVSGNNTMDCSSRMSHMQAWMQNKTKNVFTKKMLHKRLPIFRWLPQYNSQDAVGDLVAGITVGLTVIPQALAYSGIAGLPAAVSIHLCEISPFFVLISLSISFK